MSSRTDPASDAERFEPAKKRFLDGLDHFQAGRFADAETLFLASLALLPGRVSTLVNLAAARLALARPLDALAAVDEVLAIEPGNPEAWFHRGNALALLGRHGEALTAYEKLLSLNGGLAEPWLRHGQTLQRLDRHEQALASYDRALALDPDLAQAWTLRGGILRETKRLGEAAQAFARAIACGGNAELNGYYLASVDGRAAPSAAPGPYVESLFDDYAGEFDAHVVQVLGYRAHRVLAGHLGRLAAGRRFASALDLGCGTGLCGPLVKPMAGRLTGVDLSGRMLDKARALGVYDRLLQADIVEHLRSTDDRHDLVVAADVFIYLGDLAPVFAGAHRVLDAAGVLCFSAEIAGRDDPGFELLPSLRYAHSERYIRALAAGHGFDVAEVLRQPVREDQRRPIDGLFVWLIRR